MSIEKGQWKSSMFWMSHYNYLDEIRQQFNLCKEIEIHDATLRDGEQTPGVVLNADEKVRIAEQLAKMGVHRIEAGMPAVSEGDYNAVKRIAKLGLPSKVLGFARAMPDDIKKVADAGAWGVVIEVPIGYPKLRYQFGKSWEWIMERSIKAIEIAREAGLHVVYFPYDTTRASFDELEALLKGICSQAAPDSVGVIDTVGCALPWTMAYLTRKIKEITGGLEVEVHTHNDLGMACATSLGAIVAGAEVVHVCVNGLGERSGNASMEDVAVALKACLGFEMDGFRFDMLKETSELVRNLTNTDIAQNKPVVGDRVYTRESGIGIDMLFKNPLAMFSVNPEFVGLEPKVVYGKKSGKLSIQFMMEKMGVTATDEQISEALVQVKDLGAKKKGTVSEEEVKEIISKTIG